MTEPGCPFCAPLEKDNPCLIEVASLTVSTLYLDRNQTYRGQCVLVFEPRHAEGLETLSSAEYDALARDLRVAARALTAACKPDLMNYASLGNILRHLHWHIIPRYRSDPRWGGPIYTSTLADMIETRLDDVEYEAIVSDLRAALSDGA
jgi:diadenosine tetraphosphate (Ap4A) HIT family hydrolase